MFSCDMSAMKGQIFTSTEDFTFSTEISLPKCALSCDMICFCADISLACSKYKHDVLLMFKLKVI